MATAWFSSGAESLTPTSQGTETVVVCLKWVPIRPEIDPLSGTVDTDERFSGLSPADKAALEWALRVAETSAMSVRAVSLGPPAAEAGLREALAHGAGSALRVAWDQPTPLTSQAVAQALSAGCDDARLVFCGDHSLDRGSGSVPAFLADELAFGQALGCVRMETDEQGNTLDPPVVERRLDQGRRERLAVVGPTVISFEGGLELRRAPLRGAIASRQAAIDVLDNVIKPLPSANSDAVTVTDVGPFRPRPRVLPGPQGSTVARIQQLTGGGQERPASQQLELEPAEAADTVLERLRSWGYVE